MIQCNYDFTESESELRNPSNGILDWIKRLCGIHNVSCPNPAGGISNNDFWRNIRKILYLNWDNNWDNHPGNTGIWDDSSGWGDLSDDRYEIPSYIRNLLSGGAGGGNSPYPHDEVAFMCNCTGADDPEDADICLLYTSPSPRDS